MVTSSPEVSVRLNRNSLSVAVCPALHFESAEVRSSSVVILVPLNSVIISKSSSPAAYTAVSASIVPTSMPSGYSQRGVSLKVSNPYSSV